MYVELHARSAFSFLEGASSPEELAERAADVGLPALAVLDRDGVYGSPRLHKACRRLGLRAHVGTEVTLADGSRLPLLAEDRRGYRNLCRLITRMKLRSPKHAGEAGFTRAKPAGGAGGRGAAPPGSSKMGAVDLEEVAEHAGGLVALTGGDEGPVARALLRDGFDEAVATAERLAQALGPGNLYAELQRHCDRHEEERNRAVVSLAHRLGLPLLATNGVSHATREERERLDVLACVRHGRRLDEAGRLLSRNAERHLKGEAELRRAFADVPGALDRSGELSQRLGFTLADLGYEFPRYPVPEGETMASFLRKRTDEGARDRYRPYHEKARRQIERELALIEKLDLPGYFLIVWELVRFCREQGILVQGRGSAANSAVCYALGITAVDPVGMELLFERFLSEERGEWPDIDLDLPSGERRERVIQHVYERYGQRGAAMTANVITYRGRSAARDVGKVLGFDEATLGRLSTLVHNFEWQDPNEAADRPFREAGLDLRSPRVRKFLELYLSVQDLPRHLGQHSGGMVVCQGLLDAVVPLEPATMPGRVVVQWDKDDCADLGIVKIDLLGLGMMAVLEECQRTVPEAYGEAVDLAHLPPDDPEVYAALQRADTVGMFQIESRAQMSCLPRLRPTRFYDIVVQVAIIRPGPIVGNMVHPYLNRRQGREPVDCIHPDLEPVLARTLGVPLFQEQLLRMAMVAAGFSGGEAEELRRAFGFKRAERRMRDVEVKLRRGMEARGIKGETQDRIVHAITAFALYGFPESHSASFALIAYASAWLKTHYLAAFTAALLNHQPLGFYHPATLVKDAQRHGLRVRPVTVTRSDWPSTVEVEGPGKGGRVLRLGLRQVRGLCEAAGRAVVEARRDRPFASIDDLVGRVGALRRDELERLAEAGALNPLSAGGHRRAALWDAARASRPTGPLLRGLEGGESAAGAPLPPMDEIERLGTDILATGLTAGPHLLAHFRAGLEAAGVVRARDLSRLPGGRHVRVAGNVIARQRPGTARGFLFLSLEDETGIANVIATPDLFDRHRDTWVGEPLLVVEGALQNQDGVVSVRASRVEALPTDTPTPPLQHGGCGSRHVPPVTPSRDFR